jgi:phospholipid/cholesterol/gamma-HCH transport system ATP-binding protein
VLGQDVFALDQEELDRLRVRIGFLFQSSALYDSMTVRENLEFPLRRHWIAQGAGEQQALVAEALENVGLEHAIDMYPSELSGGMRRRIGLARTLILKPEIVLYDEPTTGLDPVTGKEIVDLILLLQKKYNTSSVIISHDLNVARPAANRIAVLVDGRNHVEGSYDQLHRSTDPKVQQFFIFM